MDIKGINGQENPTFDLMARMLSYHDPNFPVVAGMLEMKDETSKINKWNVGCGVYLPVF